MNLKTELLSKRHNRNSFSCGNQSLDNYFNKHVTQDIRRNLSRCYVLTDPSDENTVLGYYTLSTASILKTDIPVQFQKIRNGPYLSLPAIVLGRLAVDLKHHNKGYGRFLLIDALKISYTVSSKIAALAVIVDPIDAAAEMFYSKYGFVKLPDSGKMFIPMNDLASLFITPS